MSGLDRRLAAMCRLGCMCSPVLDGTPEGTEAHRGTTSDDETDRPSRHTVVTPRSRPRRGTTFASKDGKDIACAKRDVRDGLTSGVAAL